MTAVAQALARERTLSQPNEPISNRTHRPKVLVVDDSPLVHRLLKARLRDENIELHHAHGGEEALRFVAENDVATMLLDLNMPGMDGFEVLRHIGGKEESATMPIIVLSGQQEAQDKIMAFALGAMDYITKPFDLAELRARLRSALRIHRLVRMLSERAQLDGLTGLWNRSHLDERLAQLVASAERSDRPLSVALLDLDHFKSINDNYGHPAGDAALQGVADVIATTVRGADVPCRYGGEEFAILMPETTPDQARALCERIRQAIEGRTWSSHPDRRITISVGVCGAEGACGMSPSQWLARADEALYQAKDGGRNRVVVARLDRGKPRLAAAG
ncbi:MAG: diguanylate cyclase response regulator [Phycisphaerales bacterium]|nr:MAG: diguanylate cyclase response regulator [Phycisphaerales bacterium]